MSVSAGRRPVMRPRAASGRGVPYARDVRVLVDEAGGLVVTGPDGIAGRRAAAGEVTRVLHLDAAATADRLGRRDAATGALVFLAGVRPVLALRLADWVPPARLGLVELRTTSGAQALASGLGVPLEPAEPVDLRLLERQAVRQVLVRPVPPRAAPGVAVRLLGPLGAVMGLLAWPVGGRPAAPVLTVLSLLLGAPVVLGVARGRAHARAATAQAEPTGRGVLVPPRPAGRIPGGLLDHVLELTAHELFLRRRGQVVWLPGPAEGGVVQAVVEPEHVRLSDASGRDHAALETALWCGDEAARAELADDLRAAGLLVLNAPIDSVLVHDHGDLATAHIKPSHLQSDLERGDPTILAPGFGGIASALAAGGALGTLGWNVPLGLVLLVIALGLLGVSLTGAWRRWRADRGAVRLVDVADSRPVHAA